MRGCTATASVANPTLCIRACCDVLLSVLRNWSVDLYLSIADTAVSRSGGVYSRTAG